MAHVSVGDICIAGRSNRLALVIFLREPSAGRPEDVRVVPLAFASSAPPATQRDVVIAGGASPVGHGLIAESWNTRSLVSEMLSIPIGHVDGRVVEAVRAAEMVGIVPGVDVHQFADLMGERRGKDSDLAAIEAFEDAEVDAWNAIEAASVAETGLSHSWTYSSATYKPKAAAKAVKDRETFNEMTTVELLTMPNPHVEGGQWVVVENSFPFEAYSLGEAA